jgi:hypothetical protein
MAQAPVRLDEHAADNLRFIRQTMARSTTFTGVSGIGLMVEGVIALIGGYVAALRLSPDWWIHTWIVVAVAGFCVGLGAMAVKVRLRGIHFWSGAGTRFVFHVAPAIVAGMFITEMLYRNGAQHLMPGTWLMLYGVGVVSGGAFSPRVIPLGGGVLMALGAVCFFLPAQGDWPVVAPMLASDLILVLGFGVVHIVFGAIIARRYGG